MYESARAVTNDTGRILNDKFDYHNLKLAEWHGREREILSYDKRKWKSARLSELCENNDFSLLARYMERQGFDVTQTVIYGKTTNRSIKFIQTCDGWDFREQEKRIYSKREAA